MGIGFRIVAGASVEPIRMDKLDWMHETAVAITAAVAYHYWGALCGVNEWDYVTYFLRDEKRKKKK